MADDIVRIRPGTKPDGYGKDAPSWDDDDVERTALLGAVAAPRTEPALDANARNGVVIGLDLYLPAGSPSIEATDRVEVRGQTYTVDGDPADWASAATGLPVGQALALKRTEG